MVLFVINSVVLFFDSISGYRLCWFVVLLYRSWAYDENYLEDNEQDYFFFRFSNSRVLYSAQVLDYSYSLSTQISVLAIQ